jgi:secondary thiamine-phosphate synthase enzyme
MTAILSKEINFSTKGTDDILDITQKIRESLIAVKLTRGIVTVFVQGSTASVTTIEYEPGLLKDLPEFYEKIIPRNKVYAHDATWGDANGYAHIRSSLQGPSITIPFEDGELMLGTWQQVVFLEFDNRPRKRKVILQFIGQET